MSERVRMSAMKRWLIVLAAAAVIIGGSTAAVFALTGEGNPTDDPQAGAGEPSSGQTPIRSDEGIDPDECNLVHNIDACDEEDLARLRGEEPSGGQTPIRSGGGIDPA